MNESSFRGTVCSCELCTPLKGVLVEARDMDGRLLTSSLSDDFGKWILPGLKEAGTIAFHADGYHSKVIPIAHPVEIIRLLENGVVGYHDRIFCYPGDEITCYIHSTGSFSAKLFRHGIEKIEVLDFGKFPPHIQAAPDGFFVEDGLCWEETIRYQIPENTKPGIHSLLLKSEGYDPFAVPLLVSTPKTALGSSQVLVLASTNNWQTYNIWGGRSRYRNYEDGNSPDFLNKSSLRSTINRNLAKILTGSQVEFLKSLVGRGSKSEKWKMKKLSICRPVTNCALEKDSPFEPFNNHLAAGEWRVLAWLEKMEIEYDIISGVELHRHPELLDHYRCLLLSTHCEYWSCRMYETVQNAHFQNRLWILNFSGNTMYREVDFYDDGSIRCVSLRFSNSCSDESKLIGVRFTGDDYGSAAPYKVVVPDHWIFTDAPVNRRNPYFGGLSLNQYTLPTLSRYDPGRCGDINGLVGSGASGWETDKLTRTAPKDFMLVAKGCNKRGGADMVIREPQGRRGGVFSASSILFGGALLIDGVISKIAENVIMHAISDNTVSNKNEFDS